VGGILVKETGEVLLVVRGKEPAKGKFNIPGGFVDPYESAEEALRREVWEEVGYTLKKIEFLASFPNLYPYSGVVYHTVDMFFVGVIAEEWEFVPNAEVTAIAFRQPNDIVEEELAFDSTRRALRTYREYLSRA
jgi:ADP-ribose pyrophosphatase YjhB (NUDIX family)